MAVTLERTLEEALNADYRFEVIPDEHGGFVIVVPDMPGCMTQVESLEELPGAVREITELWLRTEYEAAARAGS